jgi:antitoxin HicB
MSKAKSVAKAKARAGLGSRFDTLMRETGDYDAVTATALKRVLAWQIGQEMKAQGVTKTALAKRMATSRSQLDRLLDPDNDEVTLSTLARVASALGREIKLELA